MSKLIVLRGPSASGKSTVASMLFKAAKNRVVLIQQDYYRFIFNPSGAGSRLNSETIHKMIESDVAIALEDGYDVIMEGILSVKSYADVLERIFAKHPEDNHLYYFDVSLLETLQRHKTKPKTDEYGEDEILKWYPTSFPSGHPFEKIVAEELSAVQAVEFISTTSGFGLSG
ncbi:kinase [Candidatus Saccharibacteria bacterium]|nr:kinase [Candidatus Saccharibacteria bacterium]